LAEPAPLPSTRVLKAMAEDNDSYVRFVLGQSRQHLATIGSLKLSAAEEKKFAQMAQASTAEQRQIEASDSLPFEIFRQRYLSPERLGL